MEKNVLDVFMISQVSVFLGVSIDTCNNDLVAWTLDDDKGELVIDFTKKEIRFVDWNCRDQKAYFAIIGIASSNGFECGDYFTEK
jgi:hypothetical protein